MKNDIYNSKVAKFLCWCCNKKLFAITTSKNCTRYSSSEKSIPTKMKVHEEVHKRQFAKTFWIIFVCSYYYECFKSGYFNCKYEVEARNKSGWPV